ncbi:ABC transporter ATP-binding protein [Oceanobacillus salinisoli]|uniref:ABC transporter ATP-binding protein n=1 Tax=Oceanobacillus salinisoli TaxID=2678611 RepID=UPI0012E1260B|nr:ABC transporter ATP-binding protein [Oceanobacillus salinisoli]
MKNKWIHLEDLRVSDAYGRDIIRQASMELFENEFVGIVGESGSGKTMTVKAILDLLPEELNMTCSKNEVLGQNLLKLSGKERKRLIGSGIGFVPQNTIAFLHPLIKIKHQIGEAFITHGMGNKKLAKEKAIHLLEKVGIREPKRVLNSYPIQLSGGMKQRVNIAMALMTDPKVIVADEPTTALDTVIQKQVLELLKEVHDKDGVSILFISHDLKIVKQFCHRVYVMYKGNVVEAGKTKEIFQHPKHTYTKELISLLPTLSKDKHMAETV